VAATRKLVPRDSKVNPRFSPVFGLGTFESRGEPAVYEANPETGVDLYRIRLRASLASIDVVANGAGPALVE
jgi:hypothetical protein